MAFSSGFYAGSPVSFCREYTPCQPVAVTTNSTLYVEECSFPATYRQKVDNGAIRPDRAQNASFNGALSELAFTVSFRLPTNALTSSAFSDILWAAGIDNGAISEHSAAGRTLQITRTDRDGDLLEVLSGCVIDNVTFTFNADNTPLTVSVSGVAAQSATFAGVMSGFQGSGISSEAVELQGFKPVASAEATMAGTHQLASDFVAANIDLMAMTDNTGEAITISEASVNSQGVLLTAAGSADAFLIGSARWATPAPNLDYSTTTRTITSFGVPVTSFSLVYATGLSLGDVSFDKLLKDCYLAGPYSITGAVNAVLTPALALPASLTVSDTSLTFSIGDIEWTDRPAYDLQRDSYAVGAFNFKAVGSSFTISQS